MDTNNAALFCTQLLRNVVKGYLEYAPPCWLPCTPSPSALRVTGTIGGFLVTLEALPLLPALEGVLLPGEITESRGAGVGVACTARVAGVGVSVGVCVGLGVVVGTGDVTGVDGVTGVARRVWGPAPPPAPPPGSCGNRRRCFLPAGASVQYRRVWVIRTYSLMRGKTVCKHSLHCLPNAKAWCILSSFR